MSDTSNAVKNQKAFDSLMNTVNQYKPMAEMAAKAFIGSYPDPANRQLNIGTVSTQTVGSVPIFGGGAPVVPVENIDKMYLLQQQAKLKQQAEDQAVMGQAMPYYKLATANASKAFNSTVNAYVQNQYSKNYGAFAGQPNAEVMARKATSSDIGFNAKLADFSATQDQWNKLYGDVVMFMSGMGESKTGKKADYLPPTLQKKFTSFLSRPETMFEEASKAGDVDLNSVGQEMDTIRSIMTPFDDVSASVKSYVDELAKTVTESVPKKIRSTNTTDMMMAVKKEFYEAKPAEYAQRIYDAHYSSIDKQSEDGKGLMQLITKMVDDQIANSVTNTVSTMSNGLLDRQKWEFEKKKLMPVPTTLNIGYNVKDSQGVIHARRAIVSDYIATQQKPIKTSFTGAQTLYDPATNTYVVPVGGTETQATVAGFGNFAKKFRPQESGMAVTAFGGGKAWNGYSNQVKGNVAVVYLGVPKEQQSKVTMQEPSGTKVKTAGGKRELITTKSYTEPQTISARVYDPHTGKWTTVNNYNVEGKQFLTDSRHVIGNVAAEDQSVNLWLNQRGGAVPTSEQVVVNKPAPTE